MPISHTTPAGTMKSTLKARFIRYRNPNLLLITSPASKGSAHSISKSLLPKRIPFDRSRVNTRIIKLDTATMYAGIISCCPMDTRAAAVSTL